MQRCRQLPEHGIGRNAPGKHHAQPRIGFQRLNRRLIHRARNAPQSVSRSFGRVSAGGMELLHLILHAGKGKFAVPALDAEHILPRRFPAEAVQMLARWERQLQKLPRPVDQLTGGNVRGAADAGTLHILALRLYQEQLRGAAG